MSQEKLVVSATRNADQSVALRLSCGHIKNIHAKKPKPRIGGAVVCKLCP